MMIKAHHWVFVCNTPYSQSEIPDVHSSTIHLRLHLSRFVLNIEKAGRFLKLGHPKSPGGIVRFKKYEMEPMQGSNQFISNIFSPNLMESRSEEESACIFYDGRQFLRLYLKLATVSLRTGRFQIC